MGRQVSSVAALLDECRVCSKEVFVRRHPEPWLICYVAAANSQQIAFKTSTAQPSSMQSARMAAAGVRRSLASRLRDEPESFHLVPLAKSEANPWQARILLGRALNNDVVLRDSSVSKSHAYFVRNDDDSWSLFAKKSINGTVVDGVPLEDESEGRRLAEGARLGFGNIVCEFASSAALYAALVG